jgi:hypothetical protein
MRLLQILGVSPMAVDRGLESTNQAVETAAIAITSDIFEHNQIVRDEVLEALDRATAEVTILAATIPRELNGRVDRLQYRFSSAALAFKAHALAAAAIPVLISPTEDLWPAPRRGTTLPTARWRRY